MIDLDMKSIYFILAVLTYVITLVVNMMIQRKRTASVRVKVVTYLGLFILIIAIVSPLNLLLGAGVSWMFQLIAIFMCIKRK
ncbi:hypothetical protein SAMN02910358_01281 [Lachnospiraceae bacterium XBB1006]|nr:hypothetical protein SAMN02910358_01281 [Lachnospiraceae bacterium XBB1006]